MTAVQDYAVLRAAKLTRVCHSLTAQVLSSCTCSEPYESITHTHTHTHTRTHAHTHTHTHTHTLSISTRLHQDIPCFELLSCFGIFCLLLSWHN
jgi:galactose-1-phosphate uridylyltransferase